MRTTTLIISSMLALLSLSLPGYAGRPAIFYVADPAALNAADQAVLDRLTVLGFSVTVIDDNLSDPADATGQELIVISSTVTSGNIGTKHTATAVPILEWEPALYDEFGIQANNANGVTITGTQIQIVDASHPLAGGLRAGIINFFNSAGGLASPDTPVAGVNIVAREVGGTRPVIVGVEKGAALNPARIATAPARRVGFPLDDTSFARLTDDGLTLFDAAINWAAGPTNAPAGVAQNPTNLTVIEHQSAAFSVIVTGAPPWSFQWQRSAGAGIFTNISGATSRKLTLSSVNLTDSGASFRVAVTNAFGNATSSAATLTVSPDTTAPTIVEASTRGNPNGLFVVFSEQVTAATATNKNNYTINNGVAVNGASLQADGVTVLLTTTSITLGRGYLLTVSGVQDTAATPNTVAANSQIQFFQTDGVIERRVFFVSGGTLAAITNSAKFTNNQPDQVTYPTALEGPVNFADNYGTQFRGYVTAPASGNYVFFICSDDFSSLYLSMDENPANKKLIATETMWSNSRQWVSSAGVSDLTAKRSDQYGGTEWPGGNTITLTAANRYYIEVIHAEGGGGDDIAVTWQQPGALEPMDGDSPIPGRYLSAFGITPGPAAVPTPPSSPPVQEPGSVTFTVATSGSPPFIYQWYRDGTLIPGATNQSYSIALVRRSDNGAKFKVTIANAFSSATSAEATLTVIPDTMPPRPVQITSVDGTFKVITMTYSELLDKASAETAQNYVFSPGNIVATNVTLDATLTNVTIRTGGALTPGVTNTLTLNGVKDLSGNAVASNTSIQFLFNPVTYAANILFDGPIAYYQFEEPTASTVATNRGSTGGDGMYVNDLGFGGPAKGDPGPRPPSFVGFDPNNRSASFDGQGDWVDTQNQFLQDRAAFTLEYWVAPSNRVSAPATFGTRIGIVGQNDAIEYGFIDQNTIQIWTPNGGFLNTTYSFPDNEWHHVATIADGTTLRNYYDGQLQGNPSGTPTADYGASTFNVHIGGGGVFDATGNFFTGKIDEVAIFDKAIPAARVAAHYAAGKSGGVLVTSGTVTVPTGITLSLLRSGNTLATSWAPATTGDILESTPLLPPTTWTPVGTNSPVNVTIGTGNLFLRVRRP